MTDFQPTSRARETGRLHGGRYFAQVRRRWAILVFVGALVTAACGAVSDDSSVGSRSDDSSPATPEPATDGNGGQEKGEIAEESSIAELLEQAVPAGRADELSSDEVECVREQVEESTAPTGRAPTPVIIELMTKWCAPDLHAKWWAESTGLRRIAIDDDDLRLCFATVITRVETSGSVEDLAITQLDGIDPIDPLRAEIDRLLLAECGMDEAAGVRAGLEPHRPLDSSVDGAAFCSAYLQRVEPSTVGLDPVEGEMHYYSDIAAQHRAIVAPAAIAEEFATWTDLLEETARVAEEEQVSGLDLQQHPDLSAARAAGEAARDAVGEYVRINC